MNLDDFFWYMREHRELAILAVNPFCALLACGSIHLFFKLLRLPRELPATARRELPIVSGLLITMLLAFTAMLCAGCVALAAASGGNGFQAAVTFLLVPCVSIFLLYRLVVRITTGSPIINKAWFFEKI